MKLGPLLLLVSGCSSLVPDAVVPSFEHLSHVSQHRPFTATPTAYGVDIASLGLRWQLPQHAVLEVSEGIALEPRDAYSESYGELIGPREEFSLRISRPILIERAP